MGRYTPSTLFSGQCPIWLLVIPQSSNHFNGKTMSSVVEIRRVQNEYFSQQTSEFCKRGIESLPERWKSIIENEGKYILN